VEQGRGRDFAVYYRKACTHRTVAVEDAAGEDEDGDAASEACVRL
jgi:hypothetical protein